MHIFTSTPSTALLCKHTWKGTIVHAHTCAWIPRSPAYDRLRALWLLCAALMTDLSSVFIKCPEFTKVRPFCLHGLNRDAELRIVDENRGNLWNSRVTRLPVKYWSSKDGGAACLACAYRALTRVAGPVSLKANSSKVIIWKKNNTLHEFQSSLQDVLLGQSCACPISRQ